MTSIVPYDVLISKMHSSDRKCSDDKCDESHTLNAKMLNESGDNLSVTENPKCVQICDDERHIEGNGGDKQTSNELSPQTEHIKGNDAKNSAKTDDRVLIKSTPRLPPFWGQCVDIYDSKGKPKRVVTLKEVENYVPIRLKSRFKFYFALIDSRYPQLLKSADKCEYKCFD